MSDVWMRCTECKKEIAFGAKYFRCSVSTCNRSRFPLVFCSVVCWDSHLGSARHREAWAEDAVAPSRAAWQAEQAEAQKAAAAPPAPAPAKKQVVVERFVTPPQGVPVVANRKVVGEASPTAAAAVEGVKLSEVVDRDILIVVSKMKKYIKDRSGMNCSDAVADMLSEHVRVLCDDSIRAAARDERKTVLDRDVPRPRR
jgi:hypothetical protein